MDNWMRGLDEKRRGFLARMGSNLSTGRQWSIYPGQKSDQADGREPTPDNFTMLQGFEWYIPDDHKHWARLKAALPKLKAAGIDNIWIPPACKASSPSGNGYDIYDLYDLGEFDQKGGVGTKWGNKKELVELCNEANKIGVGIYFDAVLNHKAGADKTERCKVVKVDPENRNQKVSDVFEIDGWLGFDFPGRGTKYSSQKYHWYHFSATDYDDASKETGLYQIQGDGKHWASDVDTEHGNYDYLMFADLDFNHPEVAEDVKNWGVHVAKELKLKGIRFDAIKHYSEAFLSDFISHLDEQTGQGWFFVGEFWHMSLQALIDYLAKMDHKFNLFDAPLVENFHRISTSSGADMRTVFDDTLVKAEPYNAVTLVMNHDTQPSQALQLEVADWFVPLAYALILLREGGYPCLFFGDLYGLRGGVPNDWREPTAQGKVPDLSLARKLFAYGEQNDYFDHPNVIGWVRRGTWDHPDGVAVVMSNTEPGEKRMFVGELHAGEVWTDVLGWNDREVKVGDDGFGMFSCGGCSVGVYVKREAKGRDMFGKFDAKIY